MIRLTVLSNLLFLLEERESFQDIIIYLHLFFYVVIKCITYELLQSYTTFIFDSVSIYLDKTCQSIVLHDI